MSSGSGCADQGQSKPGRRDETLTRQEMSRAVDGSGEALGLRATRR